MACPDGTSNVGTCPDDTSCDFNVPCGGYYAQWIHSYDRCEWYDINCPNFTCSDCYWSESNYDDENCC